MEEFSGEKDQDIENDIDFVLGNQFEKNKKRSQVAVDQFQVYSREPIVFAKHIDTSSPIKWTAIVGNAFYKPSAN